MNILVLDNYDSFTYNLVHILRELNLHHQLKVVRNDKLELEEVENFDKILLSPGPGLPESAGLMPEIIRQYASHKSILGVCLGHQGIAQNFGAQLSLMPQVKHGISTPLKQLTHDILFEGMPEQIEVGHYHSWRVNEQDLPSEIEVIATDQQGHIMALRHKEYDCKGVQFHPESILTPQGFQIIKNWVKNE